MLLRSREMPVYVEALMEALGRLLTWGPLRPYGALPVHKVPYPRRARDSCGMTGGHFRMLKPLNIEATRNPRGPGSSRMQKERVELEEPWQADNVRPMYLLTFPRDA